MSWLLSLLGVVLLSVLVDIVLPSGQTNKFIKGIFGVIIIFVIITPLIKFKNKEYDLDDIFQSNNIEVDNVFLDKVNDRQKEQVENDIIKTLEKNQIIVKKVVLTLRDNNINNIARVEVVAVDLAQSSTIKNIISRILSIDEEYILVYE